MEYNWNIIEPLGTSSPRVQSLSKSLNAPPLVALYALNKGLEDPVQFQKFLNPRLEDLKDPFSILNLEKLARKILQLHPYFQETHGRIRVFTDYDVDGTTGAALLTWFFREMGFDFDVVQPDRFRDGYGLNVEAVEAAKRDDVDLLITVDCGVTNFDALSRAEELGLSVGVIDHHQISAEKGVPNCFAVVDPHQPDDTSGLTMLCGCSLAFYVCLAVRRLARDAGVFQNRSEPNLKQLLDLVVLATAADMVPLKGDNRTLVRQGLDVLRNTKKAGLRALIEGAGLSLSHVSPSSLGFTLGPRINASGRLGSAKTALDTLTSQDEIQAIQLAKQLEGINQERMQVQNQIWDEVRNRIQIQIEDGLHSHAIVIGDAEWHEGVVGIVASKVTEFFKRPAIILALREEESIYKGSARSFGGVSILKAIQECSSFLKTFGGHPYAAGLSLYAQNFEPFRDALNRSVQNQMKEMDRVPGVLATRDIEGMITVRDLTIQNVEWLERLGPFGPGHREPLYFLRSKIFDLRILKERHVKLTLDTRLPALWFGVCERVETFAFLETAFQQGTVLEWMVSPEMNHFRGSSSVSLRVQDVREVTE